MVKAMGHLEFAFNALETRQKKMIYYVHFESSLIQIIITIT